MSVLFLFFYFFLYIKIKLPKSEEKKIGVGRLARSASLGPSNHFHKLTPLHALVDTKLVQYNGEYFKYSCHEFYFKDIETRKNAYPERRLTCIFYLCALLHSVSTQKWVQGKKSVLLGKEEGGQVY